MIIHDCIRLYIRLYIIMLAYIKLLYMFIYDCILLYISIYNYMWIYLTLHYVTHITI